MSKQKVKINDQFSYVWDDPSNFEGHNGDSITDPSGDIPLETIVKRYVRGEPIGNIAQPYYDTDADALFPLDGEEISPFRRPNVDITDIADAQARAQQRVEAEAERIRQTNLDEQKKKSERSEDSKPA